MDERLKKQSSLILMSLNSSFGVLDATIRSMLCMILRELCATTIMNFSRNRFLCDQFTNRFDFLHAAAPLMESYLLTAFCLILKVLTGKYEHWLHE